MVSRNISVECAQTTKSVDSAYEYTPQYKESERERDINSERTTIAEKKDI